MKLLFATLFGICALTMGVSQDSQKIDSLNNLLLTTQDDSTKALAIAEIVNELVYTKPDSCIYYADIGLDLINSKSLRNGFEQSKEFRLFSFEALMYGWKAVAFSEKRNDLLAIRMALKAKQLAENSKSLLLKQQVYGNLGEVYQNVGEPNIARDYILKLLSNETTELARQIWIANLGTCYYDLKEYDSALYYLNKVDAGLEVAKDRPWPYPTLYLGHTYVKKGDYQKAFSYYRTSITYAEHDNFGYDLCRAYLGIAEAFKASGITDSAIFYATKSSWIAKELSLPMQSLDASTFLAGLYEAEGMIDSAFKYQKISNALRDTILNIDKIKEVQNYTFSEKLRDHEIIQEQIAYRTKIRYYSLAGGIVMLLFLTVILIRNNRHKQRAYALLQKQKQETDIQKSKTEKTLEELRTAEAQLIQSEKMASLGVLTAGIAHEIQNPLNFVNNFSEVNKELMQELTQEIDNGNYSEVKKIAIDVVTNEEKINEHGRRADSIVKSMLQHSRVSSGKKELTDINALADEYLRISYHGMRAMDKSFNSILETNFDKTIDRIPVIPEHIGRVLLNLYNNAFQSMMEKVKSNFTEYHPTISVSTANQNGKVFITVRDNGIGIPVNVIDKIFQPFFTTKPAGSGTGLGLSLSYDIITKEHGGEIKVESKEGEGAEFIIYLPS